MPIAKFSGHASTCAWMNAWVLASVASTASRAATKRCERRRVAGELRLGGFGERAVEEVGRAGDLLAGRPCRTACPAASPASGRPRCRPGPSPGARRCRPRPGATRPRSPRRGRGSAGAGTACRSRRPAPAPARRSPCGRSGAPAGRRAPRRSARAAASRRRRRRAPGRRRPGSRRLRLQPFRRAKRGARRLARRGQPAVGAAEAELEAAIGSSATVAATTRSASSVSRAGVCSAARPRPAAGSPVRARSVALRSVSRDFLSDAAGSCDAIPPPPVVRCRADSRCSGIRRAAAVLLRHHARLKARLVPQLAAALAAS